MDIPVIPILVVVGLLLLALAALNAAGNSGFGAIRNLPHRMLTAWRHRKDEGELITKTTATGGLSAGDTDPERVITQGKSDPRTQVCLGMIIPNEPLWKEIQEAREFALSGIKGKKKLADPARKHDRLLRHRSQLVAAYSPRNLSTLVVGPSGSGKSTAIIIPATLTAGTSSMLNLSVKNDVASVTIRQRRMVSERWNATKVVTQPTAFCRVFDPSGPDHLPPDLKTAHVHWSPLTPILKDPKKDLAVAKGIAQSMVDARGSDNGGKRSDTEQFWRTAATKLLARVLYAVVAVKGAKATMWHVVDAVDELNETGRIEQLEKDLERRIQVLEAGKPTDQTEIRATRACLRALKEIDKLMERSSGGQASGYLATLQHALECFEEGELGSIAAGDDTLPFDDLLESWSTVYITAGIEANSVYKPVIAALTDSLLDYAQRKAGAAPSGALTVPMVACLDELTNLSAMDSQKLTRLISTARGYNMTVLLAVQDLSQLVARFGESVMKTLLNNTQARVFLPKVGDDVTGRAAEALFGKRLSPSWTVNFAPETKAKSRSKTSGEAKSSSETTSTTPAQYSESLTFREQPVLPFERLAGSADREAWLFVSGFTYHCLQRRWYDDSVYKLLADGGACSSDLMPDELAAELEQVSPDVLSEVARKQIEDVERGSGRSRRLPFSPTPVEAPRPPATFGPDTDPLDQPQFGPIDDIPFGPLGDTDPGFGPLQDPNDASDFPPYDYPPAEPELFDNRFAADDYESAPPEDDDFENWMR